MAYDKVVDSAALDAQLTSIADAIRAKTGGSDSLVFPDGFSQAIAAIEAGGSGGAKIATGTVVPANDNSITIEHGLGEVPNVFFWCTTDFVNHTTTTNSDGSTTVGSISNSDTLCGGHIAGQSFVINAVNSRLSSYHYLLYPNNLDKYSRKIYRLTNNKIWSDSDILANKMAGENMKGEDVKELQKRLNALGFDCGTADGIFDSKTEHGVIAFQTAAVIEVDGKFGKESFAALSAYSTPESDDTQGYATYVVQKGDTLWNLAKKLLGRGGRWTEIAALNNISGTMIRDGQVLKIPT